MKAVLWCWSDAKSGGREISIYEDIDQLSKWLGRGD